MWCVKDGVRNGANTNASHGEKPRENGRLQRLFKSFILFDVYLLVFLELRPHVNVAKCGIFFNSNTSKFHSAHFFIEENTNFFGVADALGIWIFLKGKGIPRVRALCINSTEWDYAFSITRWISFTRSKNTTKIHFPLVAVTIIAK